MSISKRFRKQNALSQAIAETLETRAYLTAVTFAAPVPIPIANSATGVFSSSVADDFNNDGAVDFATLDSANDTLNVMLNNGDGTFTAGQSLPTGHQPGSLQAVALTNGNLDLLFVNSGDGTAEFYTGLGNGGFNTTPTILTVGTGQSSGFTINAADINGNGLPDILVGSPNGNLLTLVNNGNDNFNPATGVTGGLSAIGQFVNISNRTDVVRALTNGTMQIFVDSGSGLALSSAVQSVPSTLANATGFQTITNTVTGDFNGDGNGDIATVISNTQTNTSFVSTLLGNGDGTFQAPMLTALPGGATQIQVGAFTSGSNEDLLVLFPDHTDVLTGNGDGTFTDAKVTIPETGWSSAAIADFNNDGLFDAVYGNSLLINTTGRKTTKTVVSATANPIAPGQRVTFKAAVTGTGGTPSGNVAFFDSSSATGKKLLGVGKLTAGAASITAGLGNAIASHQIVADYLGDTKFGAGSAAPLVESVEKNAGIPTGPTILTPTVLKETIPASAPAGTKLTNAAVSVKLTNSTGTIAKGPVTINVYASTDSSLDTSVDTLLTHVSKSESLKLTKSTTSSIPIKSLPSSLIGGTFHLIVQTVDSAGAASAASAGTFNVAAPVISLSETITALKLPATVASGATLHGSSVSLIVSNSGNITDNGFTIDLSGSPTSNQPGSSFLHFKSAMKIAPAKSVRVTIPLKKAPTLAAGNYFLIALTTDSEGGISLPPAGSPFVISA